MNPLTSSQEYLRLFEPMDIQFKLDLIAGLSESIKAQLSVRSDLSARTFWQLIGKIDWSASTANEKLEPLVAALKDTDVSTIYDFSEELAQCLHQLDGPEYYEAVAAQKQGVSADTFLYARC